MELVLGLFSFHLVVMGLRGFYSVPSALSSQEGCADLIINRDAGLLGKTAPLQLLAKAPNLPLATVQHHITNLLSGPLSFGVSLDLQQSSQSVIL